MWRDSEANQRHLQYLQARLQGDAADLLVFLGAGLSFGASRMGHRTYFEREQWLWKPLKGKQNNEKGSKDHPPRSGFGGRTPPDGHMEVCADDDDLPFPSWPWLISRMRHRLSWEEPPEKQEAITRFFRESGPLDCAQYFRDRVGEANYEDFLVKNFTSRWDGERYITPSHQALVALDLPTIFTSNYDELIEHTFVSAGETLRVSRTAPEFLAALRGGDRPHLVKLHGCISDPSTVVLTRDDYAAARPLEREFTTNWPIGWIDQRFCMSALVLRTLT